jgi:3'-phosphoadenosine 5'-phosphosulfate (PAPS) 3'-phosphatase
MCRALSLKSPKVESVFGPSMEWQIAAPHAILRGAGMDVRDDASDAELAYNKKDLSSDRVKIV